MHDDGQWSSATWDGAAEESLRAGARLTMAERLAWLQEMRRLSDYIEARRTGTRGVSTSGPSERPPSR